MNASTKPAESAELLEIIDLKWLLSADGHHVHVERLMSDAGYARECLTRALASPKEATQQAARRIAQRLGVHIE